MSKNMRPSLSKEGFSRASHYNHRGRGKGRFYGENAEVQLSKSLSWLLRHGAEKCGLQLEKGGFLYAEDILQTKRCQGFTLDDIRRVVASNDKQRFTLEYDEVVGQWKVRANQGHTLQVEELDLTPITLENADDFPQVIHGTFSEAWNSIKKQGLCRQSRNHIHFAPGESSQDGVISGMRKTCNVLIFVDLKAALRAGLEFFCSANKVILSAGDENGFIKPCYFDKVIDRVTRKELSFDKYPPNTETVAGEMTGKEAQMKYTHHGKELPFDKYPPNADKTNETVAGEMTGKEAQMKDTHHEIKSMSMWDTVNAIDESDSDKTIHTTDGAESDKTIHTTDESESDKTIHATDGAKSDTCKTIHTTDGAESDKTIHTTDESESDKSIHMVEGAESEPVNKKCKKEEEMCETEPKFEVIEDMSSCETAVGKWKSLTTDDLLSVVCYRGDDDLICIGDSQGNITLFDLQREPDMMKYSQPLFDFLQDSPCTKVVTKSPQLGILFCDSYTLLITDMEILDVEEAYMMFKNKEGDDSDMSSIEKMFHSLSLDECPSQRPITEEMKNIMKVTVCRQMELAEELKCRLFPKYKRDFRTEQFSKIKEVLDMEKVNRYRQERKKEKQEKDKQKVNEKTSSKKSKGKKKRS